MSIKINGGDWDGLEVGVSPVVDWSTLRPPFIKAPGIRTIGLKEGC